MTDRIESLKTEDSQLLVVGGQLVSQQDELGERRRSLRGSVADRRARVQEFKRRIEGVKCQRKRLIWLAVLAIGLAIIACVAHEAKTVCNQLSQAEGLSRAHLSRFRRWSCLFSKLEIPSFVLAGLFACLYLRLYLETDREVSCLERDLRTEGKKIESIDGEIDEFEANQDSLVEGLDGNRARRQAIDSELNKLNSADAKQS
jgi:hypothetical protein